MATKYEIWNEPLVLTEDMKKHGFTHIDQVIRLVPGKQDIDWWERAEQCAKSNQRVLGTNVVNSIPMTHHNPALMHFLKNNSTQTFIGGSSS